MSPKTCNYSRTLHDVRFNINHDTANSHALITSRWHFSLMPFKIFCFWFSHCMSVRGTFTWIMLKGVHEIHIGLQGIEAWLDHVCISSMCCKVEVKKQVVSPQRVDIQYPQDKNL